MKRIKLVGLCLIAAFAFSVAAAASAQAAKSISGPVEVSSTGVGEAELGNSVANIRCKSHTAHSTIVGATSVTNVVSHYKGCEVVGKGVACQNVGPAAIDTNKLKSDIDWVNKGAGSVGVDFTPEAGLTLAEFECPGLFKVKVYGAIIGLTSPHDVITTEGEVKFTESAFKNQPEKFEGEPNEALKAEFIPPGGQVESGQIQVDHTTNDQICVKKGKKTKCGPNPAMVNTTADPTQPQYGRCKKGKGGTQYSSSACTTPSAKGKYHFVPIPG